MTHKFQCVKAPLSAPLREGMPPRLHSCAVPLRVIPPLRFRGDSVFLNSLDPLCDAGQLHRKVLIAFLFII